MADLTQQLADLNANAKNLLEKYDGAFSKIENLSEQKQKELSDFVSKQTEIIKNSGGNIDIDKIKKDIDDKVASAIKEINDSLEKAKKDVKSGEVEKAKVAENALKLGGKSLEDLIKFVDIRKKIEMSGESKQSIEIDLGKEVKGFKFVIGSIFLRTLDSDKSDHFNILIGKDAKGIYCWDSYGQIDNLKGNFTLITHFGDDQEVKLGNYGMWANFIAPLNDTKLDIGIGGVSGSHFELAIKIITLIGG